MKFGWVPFISQYGSQRLVRVHASVSIHTWTFASIIELKCATYKHYKRMYGKFYVGLYF